MSERAACGNSIFCVLSYVVHARARVRRTDEGVQRRHLHRVVTAFLVDRRVSGTRAGGGRGGGGRACYTLACAECDS